MICLPAGAGMVRPAGGGGGGWVVAKTYTPSAINEPGYGNTTLRLNIPSADLLAGSKVRFTIAAGASTQTVINGCYVQTPTSAGSLNFSTTPIQVLFGGNPGITITGGTEAVTDAITLAVSGTSQLLLSMYLSAGTNAIRRTNGAGLFNSRAKYSVNDAANVTAASGYTGLAVGAYMITKVEVFQP